MQVEATGIPVTIGEARVAPGDLVRGDADGVVVIPKEHEDRVLDTAEAIEAAENRIRDAVRGGMRLDAARSQFKYHQLQTRLTQPWIDGAPLRPFSYPSLAYLALDGNPQGVAAR